MKSQFGKFSNEVIYIGLGLSIKNFSGVNHDYGLLDMLKKIPALNFSISTSKIHLYG